MAIVSLKEVTKIYPLGKTEVHAVNGVSFDIARGDFISIAGPSGSGKSTILNMIGCIDVPTSGTVELNNHITSGLTDREITELRHKFVGFIFQSFNLIPVLNVFENIEFPLLLGKKSIEQKKRKEWTDYLVEEVGLKEWTKHRPNELSGGQRQRVAIARSMATKPELVLADEPTANLDSETSESIIELMKKINKDMNTTFIFSTHDPTIMDLAKHIIKLKDGLVTSEYRREK
ncbi:MAG: ABC transporter ATP-binding protein [Spirochaetales bacterium]|nr:ABC transporter ATP-binding protein [Spirochaetales bacterium]